MCELKLVSSLQKVFPETRLPRRGFRGFSMLQNERSAFQAAYRVAADTPAELRIDSPLAAFVRAYQVALIPGSVAAPRVSDGYYLTKAGGLFPDLLQPVEAGQVTLFSGGSHALWLEVSGDLPAGEFPMTVSLAARGRVLASASLTVSVIGAQLPEQQLIFTNWLHTDCLAVRYGVEVFSEPYWQLVESYLRRACEFGMNMVLTPLFTPPLDTEVGGERPTVQLVDVTVTGPGKYGFSFEKLRRWVALAQQCGIKYFEIAHFFTQWGAEHAPKVMADGKQIFGWDTDARGPEYAAFLGQLADALIPQLDRLGIRDRCFFHVSDEPEAAHIPAYQAASALIHRCFPGFPVIDALSDFDFYRRGLVDTPIPANDHIGPFIGNVPRLWTYYCCAQGAHHVSNRFFAMPSQRNRVLGFQLYKYRATGFLHWAFNFWFSQFSRRPVDPFTETDAGGGFPAGDAFVVYPGPDGTPLDSLRLHVFYDGLQDLGACRLLESKIGRAKTLALVQRWGPITFSHYPHSSRWQLRTRERINRAIAKNL
ncbi:MAG: DUF4091 domain-containing protein [Eubacteriales bacterium]|nr:DUF4091 domain-containing protein [Eubacteriales bacterium]